MKELFWKQQYDKRRKMLKSNLYDVLHTLDQQQLQEQIERRVGKSILKFIGVDRNISKQRSDEICEYMHPILIKCYNELIDICKENNITLHFVNTPAGLQHQQDQDVCYVIKTQVYQKQHFIKWLEQQEFEFKQLFVEGFPMVVLCAQEEKQNNTYYDINTVQLNKICTCIRYHGSISQCQFTTQQPKQDIVECMKLNLDKNWKQKLWKFEKQDSEGYLKVKGYILNKLAREQAE